MGHEGTDAVWRPRWQDGERNSERGRKAPTARPSAPFGGSCFRCSAPRSRCSCSRGGGVAHAQTSQVLVSNLGQTTQTAAGVVEGGTAQGFRTGTNAAGYTVTSIELLLDVGTGAFPPVALHSGSPAGSTVADFTVSSQSRTTGLTVYTYIPTTSVTLDGNTDYWVVVSYAAFGQLWGVAWIGEDVTPAPGWSIPYRGQYYHPDRGLEDYGDDLANQMRVNGTINSGGNGGGNGGGGGSGGGSSSGGGSRAPSPPPAPTRSPIIGSTSAATAKEVAGDLLVLQRHDQPGVEVEVGIGWISQRRSADHRPSGSCVTAIWGRPMP